MILITTIVPLLALFIIIWFIILDKRDRRKGIKKQIDTLNAVEFSKYYKFPLKMHNSMSCKVFTDDNNMAFDWKLPHSEIYDGVKQRLLDRINGYDYTPWAVKKVFYVSGNGYIMCKLIAGDNVGKEIKVLQVRGWGMLTGVGGYNLDPIVASQIQDDFTKFILKQLND